MLARVIRLNTSNSTRNPSFGKNSFEMTMVTKH